MMQKSTEARYPFCFSLAEQKHLLWIFCDILILFLFATKTVALLLLPSFQLDYRVSFFFFFRTRTGFRTQRSVSCWHMLDCLYRRVFASSSLFITRWSGCMTWFQPLSVFTTSFLSLNNAAPTRTSTPETSDFYKRLAILCTFLSRHEMWSPLGSCTVGRLLWRWSRSNLFFHRLARILHTTVLGRLSVANSFSTHTSCRRKTALKHIRVLPLFLASQRWHFAGFKRTDGLPFYLFYLCDEICLSTWTLWTGQVGMQRRAGLNRAIITERERSSSGAKLSGMCTELLFRKIQP